jgi:hypothetical protein
MEIEQGKSDPAKFGFPQDSPQTSFGMEGGEGEGAPTDAPGSAMPPMGEAQKGPGRPKRGLSYGQDNHPRGRDPLGADELYKSHRDQKRTRADSKKFPLSYKEIINRFDLTVNGSSSKVLNEGIPAEQLWEGHGEAVESAIQFVEEHSSGKLSGPSDDKNTYLDESNLEK